jgi:2-oxoisovalerate dehydrogenase E1 component beta subunit
MVVGSGFLEGGKGVKMADAITEALRSSLQSDIPTVIMGEDVGRKGGVFLVTKGLSDEFPGRVIDTPLCENGPVGVAIGMAMRGIRVIVEPGQFIGFWDIAADQIIDQAGRVRHRSRGRLSCPIVLRAPGYGGIKAPEHHCEAMEHRFASGHGYRIVVPSNSERAHYLLLASIRDPDPVLFMEPAVLYRKRGPVRKGVELEVVLDRCFIDLEGRDITVATYGAMVLTCLEVADLLKDTISLEVIDLATVKPMDVDTVLASVEKTGRLLIVHEGSAFAGIGAELSAQVSERGFKYLKTGIRRVTAPDVIMPLPCLEDYYIPTAREIARNCVDMMKCSSK